MSTGYSGRARQVEAHVDALPAGARSAVEHSSDEQASEHLHRHVFGGNDTDIFEGRIVYSVPYLHCYLVQPDGVKTTLACRALSDTGTSVFSTKNTEPMAPETHVLVYKQRGDSFGVILGALPDQVIDGDQHYPDYVEQGGGTGFKKDGYYWNLLHMLAEQSGLGDFSSGRALDGAATGDWGRMSPTGGQINIDPFMVSLSQSERSGLWFFLFDDLARLNAYNYDLRTAAGETVVRNDCGEIYDYRGSSPYHWETLGAFSGIETVDREVSDEDFQYKKAEGKFEPTDVQQQPFYRFEEFRGYHGQAFMRHLMLPPNGTGQGLHRYSDSEPRVGVFREQLGLDGSWGITSAHSLHLHKRLLIPIPRRKAHIEDDLNGDRSSLESTLQPANYKFAGYYPADAPLHKIGNLAYTGQHINLLRTASLTNILSHSFNWKSLHPFHYHKKDFDTPQEDNLAPFTALQFVPDYSSLLRQHDLDPPREQKVRVDHRYGDQTYYNTTAGVSVLEDGSVVIRDGYGSEIRMSAGHIYLTTPGDVQVLTGRSVVLQGGDDVVVKAHKSVDITASLHDVRIKAENNLEMLGGNESQGRVLIECRAPLPMFSIDSAEVGEQIEGSGIVLKSPHSPVAVYGGGIYLRTGSRYGNVDTGDIVLDADKGAANVIMHANQLVCWLVSSVDFIYPGPAGETPDLRTAAATHHFDELAVSFDSKVSVRNSLEVLGGGLSVNGGIDVAGGHIFTEQAASYNFMVPALTQQGLIMTRQLLESSGQQMDTLRDTATQYYQTSIFEVYYEWPRLLGHDEFEKRYQFCLRTEEQMGTYQWVLPESYWQQLARVDELELAAWDEKVVSYQTMKMAPYPGYQKWFLDPTYLTCDNDLFDALTNVDVPRGERYEDHDPIEWNDPIIPQQHYPCISSP